MALNKRTYALPSEIVEEFERAVESGKRSAAIAALVREWLEEQKRARIRESVIEGCREMAEVMLEIEREFHTADEEVARAYYDAD